MWVDRAKNVPGMEAVFGAQWEKRFFAMVNDWSVSELSVEVKRLEDELQQARTNQEVLRVATSVEVDRLQDELVQARANQLMLRFTKRVFDNKRMRDDDECLREWQSRSY